ncbi:MAG TPA: DinB family protein [Terriglobales bacterium]
MKRKLVVLVLAILTLGLLPAFGQSAAPGVAKEVRDNFIDVDRKVLEMAHDWPADRYDYKLRKEMRTFGAVLVHIASGNIYAAKVGRGEKAKWDELDPAKYPDKASVVALLEKSFADSEGVLKGLPDASFTKTVDPWLSVMEHSGEHYGLLVAYYRDNGMTPPESRPKPKK